MAEFDLRGANEEEEIEREIEDCISRMVWKRFESGICEFERERERSEWKWESVSWVLRAVGESSLEESVESGRI